MDPKIIEIIKSKSEKYQKLSDILRYLFVDLANIDQSKYYLLGSFAIRAHRTINDLDINLDYDEFYKLKALTDRSIGRVEIYNNQIRWVFDLTDEYNKLTNSTENDFSIEAFQKKSSDGYPNSDYSLGDLVRNNKLTTDNNGHQFFTLKTLLEWKKTMNRPKDTADIELIENILAQNKTARPTRRSSKRSDKPTIRRSSKRSTSASKRTTKRASKRSTKRTSKRPTKRTSKRPT